jgi:glycosyltransferase involved in cell wall biosynthesis
MFLISVCIPTFNNAEYLEESIASALNQDYRNIEIVIVDDGSTDTTKHIVRGITDPRIRYVYKEHSNTPDTRNRAIKEALGEYILWLDSDDVLLTEVISSYIKIVDARTDVIYGDLYITDACLNIKKECIYANWQNKNTELLSSLVHADRIPNSSTLIKKSLFDKVGPYDTSFTRAHDYEFWTRAAKQASFKHVGKTVLKWRWHNSNMSSGSVAIDTRYEARIVKNMLKMYPLQELFPGLSWHAAAINCIQAQAYLLVVKRLLTLLDLHGALDYAQISLQLNPASQIQDIIQAIQAFISKYPDKAHIARASSQCMASIAAMEAHLNTAIKICRPHGYRNPAAFSRKLISAIAERWRKAYKS